MSSLAIDYSAYNASHLDPTIGDGKVDQEKVDAAVKALIEGARRAAQSLFKNKNSNFLTNGKDFTPILIRVM